jgi:hypothetical protein
MSSVDIQLRLSSYKCFIVEQTFSTYGLLHRIENKNEINLWKLGEGVDWTDRSIAHNGSDLISFLSWAIGEKLNFFESLINFYKYWQTSWNIIKIKSTRNREKI